MLILNYINSLFLNSKLSLEDGECPNNHADDKCIISCVQINGYSKLNCRMCHQMAYDNIEDEDPYCPVCDIPLVEYDLMADQYKHDF